jgi:hypothetical protein
MSDKTPAERKAEAEARQAEAAARKAELAALKAEKEQAEWESELARQSRDAEHRKSIAEAEDKAREAGQTLSDELTEQKLEAEAKKAIAEADKAVFDAEHAQVSTLIPDFSKIETGETTVKGETPAFASQLGRMALEQAAKKVVGQLEISEDDRVLITTDPDLASTDVVHLEVVTGLDALTKAANDLLPLAEPDQARAFALAASPILAAIASAAPGLLSLFSANRTLSSFTMTADSKAAVAAVAAGLIPTTKVQIDDFRVVQGGQVGDKERALREARSMLVERKLELEQEKAQANKTMKTALQEIAELKKRLAGLEQDCSEAESLRNDIGELQKAVDSSKESAADASVAVSLVSELITGIDTYLGSLHTIPAGGKRSPFATAVLRQQLHSDDDAKRFSKVLFIEASAGSVDQLLNDRPLWFKDKLHSIGSISITYWMIDTATSNIVNSGVASGMAQIRGKIGDRLRPDTAP